MRCLIYIYYMALPVHLFPIRTLLSLVFVRNIYIHIHYTHTFRFLFEHVATQQHEKKQKKKHYALLFSIRIAKLKINHWWTVWCELLQVYQIRPKQLMAIRTWCPSMSSSYKLNHINMMKDAIRRKATYFPQDPAKSVICRKKKKHQLYFFSKITKMVELSTYFSLQRKRGGLR